MDTSSGRMRTLIAIVCLGVAGAVVVAVVVFGVSVRSLLPLGMLILCPLMHVLMGHGAHGHHGGDSSAPAAQPVTPTRDGQ